MKRPLLVAMAAFSLAICLIAASDGDSREIVIIRVLSAVSADTVAFDMAMVWPDTQQVRQATTPMEMNVAGEARVTAVFRRIAGEGSLVVEVYRSAPFSPERALLASSTNEVIVVTLGDQGVSVGGLPSR